MKSTKKKIATKKASVTKKKKLVPKIVIGKKYKNQLTYIFFAAIMIAIIAIGALFFQKIMNDIAPDQSSIQTSANSLKTQAIQLLHSDPAKSKSLFKQARVKYVAINDQNNIVDVEAQLYLIDHVVTNK